MYSKALKNLAKTDDMWKIVLSMCYNMYSICCPLKILRFSRKMSVLSAYYPTLGIQTRVKTP
jgi:hypothetical protein